MSPDLDAIRERLLRPRACEALEAGRRDLADREVWKLRSSHGRAWAVTLRAILDLPEAQR